VTWPRPVPTIGDRTSAAERSGDPRGWALPSEDVDALHRVLAGRRDVRRFRPDPVPEELLRRVLGAAHQAPSVGHSQPWRFVLVAEASTRQRAAVLADAQRLTQAALMTPEAGRHLLDLDLEGIREAPLGIVVCCDRRTPAPGVLGRATFVDADLWSCACAIENLWLAARAEGLGVGWVTLFDPDELARLVAAPAGVSPLGWLCVGWPDERPPAPGLERRGWSRRVPLDEVVMRERWPAAAEPPPPVSRLASQAAATPRAPRLPGDSQPLPPSGSSGAGHDGDVPIPPQAAVVAIRDDADRLLSPPRSLGALDVVVDRLLSLGVADLHGASLVLACADHPVAAFGVSAYPPSVTRHVAEAALAGQSLGARAAESSGLGALVVDAGVHGPPLPPPALGLRPSSQGDLVHADALPSDEAMRLVSGGARLGEEIGAGRLVALGEVGVANTTVAAALAALLLDRPATEVAGLGAGADRAMLDVKIAVIEAVVARVGRGHSPETTLAGAGGPEIAVLTGVTLGVARAGGAVVLDGLATSVAALVAVRLEPAVSAHLVAGQRSREPAHGLVLTSLGLEPLLDLRLRAGEGVGAALAAGLLGAALRVRADTARTA